MVVDLKSLPDDVEALRNLVLTLARKNEDAMRAKDAVHEALRERDESILRLKDRVSYLERCLFSPKSERRKFDAITVEQSLLFNEVESSPLDGIEPERTDSLFTQVPSHRRRRGGRNPLPAHLVRREILHDIPEEERKCAHGHVLSRMGEEITEKLTIVPAKAYVERHIRPKYVCRKCEEEDATIRIAPLPKMLLPKAIPSADFMAFSITQKFADRIPFYHLAKVFTRSEIEISRDDLSRWTIQVFDLHLKGPVERLREELFRSSYLQLDETPLQVLREKDRSNTQKSFMHVAHGWIRGRPVALFHYEPTRSVRHLEEWLRDFSGVIQTDGFESYGSLLRGKANIVHAGCNVHARRKFVQCPEIRDAQYVISEYAKIYAIESMLEKEHASPERILEMRRKESLPILEGLRARIMDWILQYQKSGDMGKAMHYFIEQYDKLRAFIDHPEIRPDTNLVENDIRPFATGRKNWLFAGSPAGAEASAGFYSLVRIAELNGWDPFLFLLTHSERLKRRPTRSTL